MSEKQSQMRCVNATLLLATLLVLSTQAVGQESQVLSLHSRISLTNVKGRIDHFSVDVKGQRLFVAAVGNLVQFLAMRGAWGTHYDALDPDFPKIGFWPTYIRVAFVPNIFFMEAYTVIVGVLVGCVACALWGRAHQEVV